MKKILLSVALLSTFAFSAQDICGGLYKAGDYKKAGDCYTKQVKTNNSVDNNYFAGDSLLQQGRYKEALPYIQKFEQLSTSENDLFFAYNKLSVIFSKLGDNDLELAYKMKALNLSLKQGNKKSIASSYANLGVYYFNIEDKKKALEYFYKSLDYYPENLKSDVYSNIAVVYVNLNDYAKAREFYNKANELNLKTGNYLSLCNSKVNFGTLEYELDNYLEADKILNEAKTICHNAGDISVEAIALIYLSSSAIEQNNIQLAKSYYNQAKPLVNKSGATSILRDLKDLENKIASYK